MTYSKKTLNTLKKPLVNLSNITVKYENLIALNKIDLTINEGEYVFIIGPNGAGKSTLIKLLTKTINQSEGEISINTNSVGYLPQNLNIKPNFPITVHEVIYTGFKKQKLFISKEEKELIDCWLDRMEISHSKNALMNTLSGGQQQRVYLIRALISNPKLLILDEPTSALDPNFRPMFYELLDELHKTGTTIIFITHDINESVTKGKIIYLDQRVKFVGNFDDYKSLEGNSHV